MTRLADVPTPSFNEDYFSTFEATESDFPMMVNLEGVDYLVDDEMELAGLRKRFKKIARPITRVTGRMLKPLARPLRPIVARVAVVPTAGLLSPKLLGIRGAKGKAAYRQAGQLVRKGVLPTLEISRLATQKAMAAVAPKIREAPAPIETTIRPVDISTPTPAAPPPAEVAPTTMYPGAGGGGGAPSEGAAPPEETPSQEAPPEEAAKAPTGGAGPLLIIGAIGAGLYLWSQKG